MSCLAVAFFLAGWSSTLYGAQSRHSHPCLLAFPAAFVAGVAALRFTVKSRATSQRRSTQSRVAVLLLVLLAVASVLAVGLVLAGLSALAKGFWH